MKYFIYLLFSFSIFLSITIFNIINRYNSIDIIQNNKLNDEVFFYDFKKRLLSDLIKEEKNKTNEEYMNKTLIESEEKIKYFKLLSKRFKEQIFDGNVNYTNYTKNNETNITKNGLMKMRVFMPYDKDVLNYEKFPTFTIKILENKTIDNWYLISFVNNKSLFNFYNNKIGNFGKNITLNSYNETFISLSYNSRIDKGNYFSLPYYMSFCNIQYDINLIEDFPNKDNSTKNINNDTSEIIGIEGFFNSNDCKIKMEFSLKKHSKTLEELYISILIYSSLFSLFSLFHLINTKLLVKKIDLSIVNCNSICIFTICQNIIWNCYCCYNHFFLLLNYMQFKFYFLLICTLNFTNFGFIEFPLLYQLLSLKYSHLINDVLAYRKKIIQFCFVFYITILFSFIYGMKCFYSPPFILFSILFAWLPQIVFNVSYKNRVSFPIIYIISVVLNRFFPSFFFNYFENNFLRIPPNKNLAIMNIIILIVLTLLLYSQTLFGPRWFLPMLQIEEYNFYIDEKELRKLKKDIIGLECLICLNPIIESKNNNDFVNYDNGTGFNETDNLVIEVNDNSAYWEKQNKKCFKICKFKYRDRCFDEKSIFLNFHEFSKNIMNKPFMITPCMHVFHSECLEEWFKMKKECPNCRTIITQDMYN